MEWKYVYSPLISTVFFSLYIAYIFYFHSIVPRMSVTIITSGVLRRNIRHWSGLFDFRNSKRPCSCCRPLRRAWSSRSHSFCPPFSPFCPEYRSAITWSSSRQRWSPSVSCTLIHQPGVTSRNHCDNSRCDFFNGLHGINLYIPYFFESPGVYLLTFKIYPASNQCWF